MERVRSLAEIAPGQTVTVRRILFEVPRLRCGDLGLYEGDRVRLGRRDGEALVLRRRDGGCIQCPADVARFIEVGRGVN
jgi:hypothetical protein